ncbi:MAG: diguanylate cyclase [Halioglobus sp.]
MKAAPPRALTAMLVFVGIAVVGYLDYLSGNEIRIFPLYYLPIILAAWVFRWPGALIASLLASFAWLISLLETGNGYSNGYIWVINTFTQGVAFLMVSLLVAKLREFIEREQVLGRTDPLTQLYNTRAFNEQTNLVLGLCHRYSRPVTLAFIDLDNFKNVNDTLGHAQGDALLRKVASVLQSSFRSSDIIARLGGDEFAVLFPETEAEHAGAMLERLRQRLIEIPELKTSAVSASIGAIAYVIAPEHPNEMLKRADALMYSVKKAGKNRVMLDQVAG